MLPTPPDELIAELAARYIQLSEGITGESFEPDLRPLEQTVLEALGEDGRKVREGLTKGRKDGLFEEQA